jgi:hypothetical protein
MIWHPHGGSGMSLTLTEVLDLEPGVRDWLLERAGRQRQEEADAIAKAHRR